MGRILFESPTRTLSVSAPVRRDAQRILDGIYLEALNPEANYTALVSVIPDGADIGKERDQKWWVHDLKMRLKSEDWNYSKPTPADIVVNGVSFKNEYLKYNTAFETGPDAIKLLTRLHAQSEIHAFVDGPNRAWLADVIENASKEILQDEENWSDIISFLRENDEEMVVTSYTVCSSFIEVLEKEWIHSKYYGIWDTPELYDDAMAEFRALPLAEQWAGAREFIYRREREMNSGGMLGYELTPHNWGSYRIGDNTRSANDLLEMMKASGLDVVI